MDTTNTSSPYTLNKVLDNDSSLFIVKTQENFLELLDHCREIFTSGKFLFLPVYLANITK